MKKAPGFLAAGAVGVAALLLGQAWDFYLHAADPTLAHREGIFAVSNPGHVLLGVGLVLVVVGVLGAAYSALPLGDWWRRSFLIGFLGRRLRRKRGLGGLDRAVGPAAVSYGGPPAGPGGQPPAGRDHRGRTRRFDAAFSDGRAAGGR